MKTNLYCTLLGAMVWLGVFSGLTACTRTGGSEKAAVPSGGEDAVVAKGNAGNRPARIPAIDEMQTTDFETASFGLG